MIRTQAEARRLRSMDDATAIGRLADDVVLALLHGQSRHGLDPEDRDALERTEQWLGDAMTRVTDPLSLASPGRRRPSAPGVDSFGPRLATAALDALPPAGRPAQGHEILETLRLQIRAVLEDRASAEDLRQLRIVFDAVAEAMLVSSRSMRPTAKTAAWKTI